MNQVTVPVLKAAGSFAEDKDVARDLRLRHIIPALEAGKQVVIDFAGVEGATQSFVHALISDLIRKYGSDVLDAVYFKNCSLVIQKIITIVVDYMQQGSDQ